MKSMKRVASMILVLLLMTIILAAAAAEPGGEEGVYVLDFDDAAVTETTGSVPAGTHKGETPYFTYHNSSPGSSVSKFGGVDGTFNDDVNYKPSRGWQPGGKTSIDSNWPARTIQFTTEHPNAVLRVWWNTGNSDRNLMLWDDTGTKNNRTVINEFPKPSNRGSYISEYTIEDPKTYFLGSTESVTFFKVEVTDKKDLPLNKVTLDPASVELFVKDATTSAPVTVTATVVGYKGMTFFAVSSNKDVADVATVTADATPRDAEEEKHILTITAGDNATSKDMTATIYVGMAESPPADANAAKDVKGVKTITVTFKLDTAELDEAIANAEDVQISENGDDVYNTAKWIQKDSENEAALKSAIADAQSALENAKTQSAIKEAVAELRSALEKLSLADGKKTPVTVRYHTTDGTKDEDVVLKKVTFTQKVLDNIETEGKPTYFFLGWSTDSSCGPYLTLEESLNLYGYDPDVQKYRLKDTALKTYSLVNDLATSESYKDFTKPVDVNDIEERFKDKTLAGNFKSGVLQTKVKP